MLRTAVDNAVTQLSPEEQFLAESPKYNGPISATYTVEFPKVDCRIDFKGAQLSPFGPDVLTAQVLDALRPQIKMFVDAAANITSHLSLIQDEIENLSLAKRQGSNTNSAESDFRNAV
jgi:hypothetical protein